ncbi:class II glutamine amidotransferase domain-containing protein, partial [Staphylococcus warneri]|uniref:hypothetical protein n=1 Tax=Staphylococcus warneri TaxID=1292 RepID=UPI0016429F01
HQPYQSKLPLLHSTFTTNTFPTSKPPHPNPLLIHNAHINTIKPNLNSIPAPQNKLLHTLFPQHQHKIHPILHQHPTHSSILHNPLHFLSFPIQPHKPPILLIPHPSLYNKSNHKHLPSFYQFYTYLMQPSHPPTIISF